MENHHHAHEPTTEPTGDYLDGLKWDAYIYNDIARYNKAIRLELGDDWDADVTQDHPAADAPPVPASWEIDPRGEVEPRPDAPPAPSFPLFENDLDQAIARARGAAGSRRKGDTSAYDNDRSPRPDHRRGPDLGL